MSKWDKQASEYPEAMRERARPEGSPQEADAEVWMNHALVDKMLGRPPKIDMNEQMWRAERRSRVRQEITPTTYEDRALNVHGDDRQEELRRERRATRSVRMPPPDRQDQDSGGD